MKDLDGPTLESFKTVTFRHATPEVVDDPLCSNLPKEMYGETNENHDLMFLTFQKVLVLFFNEIEQDFGQSWDEAWMMWDETNLPKMNTGNAPLISTSVSVV